MFRKVLLSVIAVVVIAIPAVVGAHYYSSGYYRTVYQEREVTEYVPERKYVCDDYDRYPYYNNDYRYNYGYNEVRFHNYDRDYRRCYYTTSYERKTRTVRVPVKQYVNTSSYDYDYGRDYTYNYDRPSYYYSSYNTYRPASYYGYYYGI